MRNGTSMQTAMTVVKWVVGSALLAGVLAAGWHGVRVGGHIWFYSGRILGDLEVFQPFLPTDRNRYTLSADGKVVGEISELDGWFIDGQYAYGTLLGPQGGTAHFLFDCRDGRFDVFTDETVFAASLAARGFTQRHFMSGENVVRMKYGRRLFSGRCER